jgi:hypothetical protein
MNPSILGTPQEKGILRTFRPSKNHSTKIKRSRTRLQLVLRENWCWDPLLCAGGSAFLMRCLRTPFREETTLLSVRKIPFLEASPGTPAGPILKDFGLQRRKRRRPLKCGCWGAMEHNPELGITFHCYRGSIFADLRVRIHGSWNRATTSSWRPRRPASAWARLAHTTPPREPRLTPTLSRD